MDYFSNLTRLFIIFIFAIYCYIFYLFDECRCLLFLSIRSFSFNFNKGFVILIACFLHISWKRIVFTRCLFKLIVFMGYFIKAKVKTTPFFILRRRCVVWCYKLIIYFPFDFNFKSLLYLEEAKIEMKVKDIFQR